MSEDVFRYRPVPDAAPASRSEVGEMLNALEELLPGTYQLLIEAVENDALVQELPEDECTLAEMIRRLRRPASGPTGVGNEEPLALPTDHAFWRRWTRLAGLSRIWS